MTLIQEAVSLIQQQPEEHIKLIIDLLRTMMPEKKNIIEIETTGKRLGIAKGKISLPDDFDENFDAMDDEIASLFYDEGNSL